MRTNRRHFLSLLGVGAVSAPLAAKAAAEHEVMTLTSLKNANYLAQGVAAQGCSQDIGGMKQESPYVLASRYLKLMGLPQFVEQNIRERARNISHLDPDIACKKTWSLNVKIAAQRERNFNQELERYHANGKYDAAQSAFQKIAGFQWPW